jgi:hypothetical protein
MIDDFEEIVGRQFVSGWLSVAAHPGSAAATDG